MARRHDPFFEMSEALIVYETPELLARRARLRRVVLGTLSASVALLLAGLLLRHSARTAESALVVTSRPRTATRSALLSREAPAPAVATSSPVPAVSTSLPAPAVATSSPVPAVSTSLPVPSSSPVQNDDPRELTRAARALLAAGQTREGVAAARVAVDANPGDAEPYILLATGLQDLGNWPEARAVFTACEQKTARGPNASCRYFAGR